MSTNMASNKVSPIADQPQTVGTHGTNFRVTWSGLKYVVRKNALERLLLKAQGHKNVKPSKQIFNNLNGFVESGQLTAIMGPSGAGKSTLLECIANKRLHGRTGDIFVEGSTKVKMAFIPQHDNYYEVLTVRECVVFSSKLYNSTQKKAFGDKYLQSLVSKGTQDIEEGEKKAYLAARRLTISHRNFHEGIADDVLQMLGLEGCADVTAGSISGGQKKRLSIAQELVCKPNVLILDEPTSGLDSSACVQTVELLYQLTQQSPPMAIVATVHQPNAKVFGLFHKVLMLSVSGRCIYDGPPGQVSTKLVAADPALECPMFYNPADYLIEIASGEHGLDKIDVLSFATDFEQAEAMSKASHLSGSPRVDMKVATKPPKYPVWKHFKFLVLRSFLLIVRDPTLMSLRFGSHVFIALFVGYLYGPKIGLSSGCPPDLAAERGFDLNRVASVRGEALGEMRNLMDNFSNLFFNVLILMFGAMMPTLLTFPMEMSIFVKETNNGAYGPGTYYLAKMIADIPFQLIFPALYVSITFYLNSQYFEVWRFMSYLAILVLTGLVGQSIGLVFGALFMRTPMSAVFLAPLSILPTFLFSGFLVKLENMPESLRPLSWASSVRFSMEGVLITLYGHARCTSDPKKLMVVKHIFTKWVVAMVRAATEDEAQGDEYEYELEPSTNGTLLVSTTEPGALDVEAFGATIVDSLMGGVGGVSLMDTNGHPQSGVMGIFGLMDDHLEMCFVMLAVNLIFFRVLIYVLVLWRASQKK